MKATLDSRWIQPLRGFDDKLRLEIYDAIFDYLEGKEIKLSEKSNMAFSMIRPMLDTQRPKKKETKLFEAEEFRSEELKKLDEWMSRITPYIYHNISHLTQREFECLLKQYGIKAICDTLQQIENRKDLRKKYTSLYRTLLNWLKNGT